MIAPKVFTYLLHCGENVYLLKEKKEQNFSWLSLDHVGNELNSLYLILILFCRLSTSAPISANNLNIHYFINWSRKNTQSQLGIPWRQYMIMKCVFYLSYYGRGCQGLRKWGLGQKHPLPRAIVHLTPGHTKLSCCSFKRTSFRVSPLLFHSVVIPILVLTSTAIIH